MTITDGAGVIIIVIRKYGIPHLWYISTNNTRSQVNISLGGDTFVRRTLLLKPNGVLFNRFYLIVNKCLANYYTMSESKIRPLNFYLLGSKMHSMSSPISFDNPQMMNFKTSAKKKLQLCSSWLAKNSFRKMYLKTESP